MTKRFTIGILIGLLVFLSVMVLSWFSNQNLFRERSIIPSGEIANQLPAATPPPSLPPVPSQKILANTYHIFQSFNNCGPAALSMTLSYYGIQESQETLGKALRPFQVPGGDNDDKSVTLEEVAQKATEYNLTPYRRPNGSIEIIQQFIALDIPVITRTWLKADDDIGHYRIVKGYDDTTNEIIQDDSLQGKNLRYSYDEFNEIWKKFNYEYLVLIPQDKIKIAETILGEDADFTTAWKKAAENSRTELAKNPDDVYERFNLSVALYNTKNYQESVNEFEKIENRISFRTLWYQIEPIESYYELGNYDKIFSISDRILNNQNRAFSELYILRGNSYLKQGNKDSAKVEFEKAVFYNTNLKAAQDALASVN